MHTVTCGIDAVKPEIKGGQNKLELRSINDVAVALKLSPWTVRAHGRQGTIKLVRLGTRVMVNQAEIDRICVEGLPSLKQRSDTGLRGEPPSATECELVGAADSPPTGVPPAIPSTPTPIPDMDTAPSFQGFPRANRNPTKKRKPTKSEPGTR